MNIKTKQNQGFIPNNKLMWYTVQVYSGFEQSIVDHIKNSALLEGLKDDFAEFYYPIKETSDQNIVTKTKSKAVYPGYLFIKMKLNERSWELVSRTTRVLGFVGPNKLTPQPLSDKEYEIMVQDIEIASKKSAEEEKFTFGDTVTIKEGSFQSLTGSVSAVDDEKKKVTIVLRIFDRETTLDLDWSQIEKATKSN